MTGQPINYYLRMTYEGPQLPPHQGPYPLLNGKLPKVITENTLPASELEEFSGNEGGSGWDDVFDPMTMYSVPTNKYLEMNNQSHHSIIPVPWDERDDA